ncbi:MAG TPA: hypothetical protein VFD54_18460 [Anaerolineales bacterium]|nr:hypothetical protein [Anaerolineales bacterium]
MDSSNRLYESQGLILITAKALCHDHKKALLLFIAPFRLVPVVSL